MWVDGTRWTKYFSRDTLVNVNATKAVRDIPVSSIQLMEVYSGVARIPGEYLDDACAVILIWRK
ncbi:MAG: hypothetical protein IPP90_07435 [Gemmatimonadaceae bacterium]|nr:hypothetical protein [Gemmatimonadaceae bacterium]